MALGRPGVGGLQGPEPDQPRRDLRLDRPEVRLEGEGHVRAGPAVDLEARKEG